MKVILLQNIKGLGQIGDVKNVSDGHARNFLFPRKLAKVATDGGLKEVESLQKHRAALNAKEQENAQKAAAMLKDTVVEFKKKASPTGTLFSSVSKQEIAEALTKQAGVKIDADMLDLGEHGGHIKHMGEHSITIDLAPDLKVEVKAKVLSAVF